MARSIEDTNLSDWAFLPDDLLHEITDRLDKPSDYVRFGAVCKGWFGFSVKSYKEKQLLHTNQQLPLLLIPTEHDQESRGLYSITKGMVYDKLQLHVPFPNRRCCGSSFGWLFFVENKSTLELILLNPFLGESKSIKLPPIRFCSEDEVLEMDQYGVVKAVLSKDPYLYPHDYEVVALYGGYPRLAHYISGDRFWSYAKTKMDAFADVIFYKGLIIAVDRRNWIVTVTRERLKSSIISTNRSPWHLKLNTINKKLPMKRHLYSGHAYLVENSKGDLLLARRYYWHVDKLQARKEAEREREAAERAAAKGAAADREEYITHDEDEVVNQDKHEESGSESEFEEPNLTVNFKVYRLSFSSAGKKLRMKTLHGETLFLGDNHSICVSTSEYPELRPNSIYYTDDYTDIYPLNVFFGSCDTGIFNVQDGSFGKHFVPSFSTKGMPPPIFVVPRYKYNLKRIV